MHAVGEEHDAPARELPLAPTGSGVLRSCQLEPSHLSANGTRMRPPLARLGPPIRELAPTAMQETGDRHETDDRLPYDTAGAGTA
jgi:hypothetical protein